MGAFRARRWRCGEKPAATSRRKETKTEDRNVTQTIDHEVIERGFTNDQNRHTEKGDRMDVGPNCRPYSTRERYFPFLMVSTTCVDGFDVAVLTVVKRPLTALRPILVLLDIR